MPYLGTNAEFMAKVLPLARTVDWMPGVKIADMVADLNAKLHQLEVTPDSRVFSADRDLRTGAYATPEIPPFKTGPRWMAVFPVTGSSEGIYLHLHLVEFNDADERVAPLLALGKVWDWNEAWDVIQASHILLGA